MDICLQLYLIGSLMAWGMVCSNLDGEGVFVKIKLQVMAATMSWFAVGIGFGHILKDIDDRR